MREKASVDCAEGHKKENENMDHRSKLSSNLLPNNNWMTLGFDECFIGWLCRVLHCGLNICSVVYSDQDKSAPINIA